MFSEAANKNPVSLPWNPQLLSVGSIVSMLHLHDKDIIFIYFISVYSYILYLNHLLVGILSGKDGCIEIRYVTLGHYIKQILLLYNLPTIFLNLFIRHIL